jgi:cytochrome P450
MTDKTLARAIPTISRRDAIVFNVAYVVPYFLQGIFTRSRFWVNILGRIHPDPMAVSFVSHLRRKYRNEYIYVYMVANKSLLVLDEEGIKRVLDNSPLIYADARLKRMGMSHFQPHALTISRGDEWKDRRAFNEGVLYHGPGGHQFLEHFLAIIRDEIARRRSSTTAQLTWSDIDDLFQKIMLQIIFGKAARDDVELWGLLKQMLKESNRVFGLKKSSSYETFYAKVRHYLQSPEPDSLVWLCTQVPSTETTRVENQIPHWMFAMNETLAINTARALALVTAHPEAEMRVRAEIADLSDAQAIHRMKYLEACVQEAMRLWPTTPMLVRETVAADTLGGESIPSGTQVLILSSFNHRDRQAHTFADHFAPEIWLDGRIDYHFNHFSNGTQVCAAKDLALFIAKAVLAILLHEHQYVLKQPRLEPAQRIRHGYNYFKLVWERRAQRV